MISWLRIRADHRHGRTTISDLSSSGQLAARQTGDGQIHLVSRAAGPLNGDRIDIDIRVGAGVQLTVRTTAAAVALPAAGRQDVASSLALYAEVADDAGLRWLPEPTIVASGATVQALSQWVLAESARLHCREITVLGRHGESGGTWRGRTVLSRGGVECLSQTVTSDVFDRAGIFTGRPERVAISEFLIDPHATDCRPSVAGPFAVTMNPALGLVVGSALGPDVSSVTADLARTVAKHLQPAQVANSGARPAFRAG